MVGHEPLKLSMNVRIVPRQHFDSLRSLSAGLLCIERVEVG